jgi:hypothetical protein
MVSQTLDTIGRHHLLTRKTFLPIVKLPNAPFLVLKGHRWLHASLRCTKDCGDAKRGHCTYQKQSASSSCAQPEHPRTNPADRKQSASSSCAQPEHPRTNPTDRNQSASSSCAQPKHPRTNPADRNQSASSSCAQPEHPRTNPVCCVGWWEGESTGRWKYCVGEGGGRVRVKGTENTEEHRQTATQTGICRHRQGFDSPQGSNRGQRSAVPDERPSCYLARRRLVGTSY